MFNMKGFTVLLTTNRKVLLPRLIAIYTRFLDIVSDNALSREQSEVEVTALSPRSLHLAVPGMFFCND